MIYKKQLQPSISLPLLEATTVLTYVRISIDIFFLQVYILCCHSYRVIHISNLDCFLRRHHIIHVLPSTQEHKFVLDFVCLKKCAID